MVLFPTPWHEAFADEAACLAHIFALRFGEQYPCPRCERATRWHPFKAERAYACQWCGHHLHPTAGTLIAGSKLPLKKWFHAAGLCAGAMPPKSRFRDELDVNRKTAWRIHHLLSLAHPLVKGAYAAPGSNPIDRMIRAAREPAMILLVPKPLLEKLREKRAAAQSEVRQNPPPPPAPPVIQEPYDRRRPWMRLASPTPAFSNDTSSAASCSSSDAEQIIAPKVPLRKPRETDRSTVRQAKRAAPPNPKPQLEPEPEPEPEKMTAARSNGPPIRQSSPFSFKRGWSDGEYVDQQELTDTFFGSKGVRPPDVAGRQRAELTRYSVDLYPELDIQKIMACDKCLTKDYWSRRLTWADQTGRPTDVLLFVDLMDWTAPKLWVDLRFAAEGAHTRQIINLVKDGTGDRWLAICPVSGTKEERLYLRDGLFALRGANKLVSS